LGDDHLDKVFKALLSHREVAQLDAGHFSVELQQIAQIDDDL
jgi:hypothetical protein